jgi:hypothetical protein
LRGERAVIDIGAGDHAGRGDILVDGAARHDERHPFAQCLDVFGIFHAAVEMMRGQRGVALFEKIDMGLAVDEAHVRHGMDEQIRRGDRLLADQIGPELPRQVELGIDLERFGNIDAAVGAFRRVIEFAQSGVPGAGIVPGIRAFQRRSVQGLENLDAQRRFELIEKHASVALMMPAPTRTTSGLPFEVPFMIPSPVAMHHGFA